MNQLMQTLATVVSIPVTPFVAAHNLAADFEAYAHLVNRMVTSGIRVVTPNGNTSEFYSLTPAEAEASVQASVTGAGDQALVLAGVGYDAQTAIQMARYAASQGVQAVMIHQPVHPFLSGEGWVAYHQTIADAVPELGIVPYLRDPAVTPDVLARLADVCPNLVAVKYAVPSPIQFAATVRKVGADRLTWICGLAESWAPFFWPGGAVGFTSGLVNVDPGLSLHMQASLEAGDYAAAMQVWATVRPFEELRARRANANNVSVVKEAMAQLGLCEATVRPPISTLPESERQEVSAMLPRLVASVSPS